MHLTCVQIHTRTDSRVWGTYIRTRTYLNTYIQEKHPTWMVDGKCGMIQVALTLTDITTHTNIHIHTYMHTYMHICIHTYRKSTPHGW